LASPAGKVRKELAIWDRRLAIFRPAARWLRPLRSRWLSQAREFVELRVDIRERVLVIMRADQKDHGSIVRGKCNHHPERSGKMRYTDLGEKIVTRQSVIKGRATVCAQREEELVIRAPLLLMQLAYLRLTTAYPQSWKSCSGWQTAA
jgi:hypothetical protein